MAPLQCAPVAKCPPFPYELGSRGFCAGFPMIDYWVREWSISRSAHIRRDPQRSQSAAVFGYMAGQTSVTFILLSLFFPPNYEVSSKSAKQHAVWCNGNALDLYSEGTQFECRPSSWLFLIEGFHHSPHCLQTNIKTASCNRPRPFPSKSVLSGQLYSPLYPSRR